MIFLPRRRNPSRNIKPLAYGLAYQSKPFCKVTFSPVMYSMRGMCWNEIKDGTRSGSSPRKVHFKCAVRAVISIPGKFTHHSSPHTGSTLSSSSACRPIALALSAPHGQTPLSSALRILGNHPSRGQGCTPPRESGRQIVSNRRLQKSIVPWPLQEFARVVCDGEGQKKRANEGGWVYAGW